MYQGHKEPIRSLRWDIVPTPGSFHIVSKIIQCLYWIFYDTSTDAEACYNVAERVSEWLQVAACEMQKHLYLTKYALLFLFWKVNKVLVSLVVDMQKCLFTTTCERQRYLYLTKYALLFRC